MRKTLVVIALVLVLSMSFSAVAAASPVVDVLPHVITTVILGVCIDSAQDSVNDLSPGEYNGQKGHWTRYGEFVPAVN